MKGGIRLKSTKVLMVAFLVVLAAALLVGPVAARIGYNQIQAGDTIFIYEKNLTFVDFTDITRLVHYSDFSAKSVDDVIAATPSGFNVPSTVKFPGEVYYAWNAAGFISDTDYVVIDMPEISVDIVNGVTLVDKLNDKTITKGTNVTFRIISNVPSGFNVSSPAFVELRFTTPDGGQTRSFGGVDYTKVNLTSVDFYTRNAGNVTDGFGVSTTDDVTSGLWQVRAMWPNTATFNEFYGEGVDSSVKSFTIASGEVTLSTNKDQVVRNNGFSLQITGRGNQQFYLYVRDASLSCDEYPWMIADQPGVKPLDSETTRFDIDGVTNEVTQSCSGATNPDSTFNFIANVTTTASGSRTIQWDTNDMTKDRTFTFDVYERNADGTANDQTSDSVTVKVVKGTVTVDVGGEKTFYMGQEVKFTGENTDSETVYLFITGPNLCSCGAPLENPSNFLSGSVNCNTMKPTQVTVKGDNSWEYKWNTADVGLDAGTYTVYAVTTDVDKCTLSDAIYDQVSVTLRKPFINASLSASRVAKGDELKVTGTAEGNPDDIYIWIFGTNFVVPGVSEAVEDDNTFEYKIDRGTTEDMTSGQYFVVVQHPMYNGEQDIFYNSTDGNVYNRISGEPVFALTGSNRLMGSDAAEALVTALDSPNVDDTYTRLFFLVEEPFINIEAIPDQTVGATFTMSGTTNLAVDDSLLITVTSSSFQPTQKTTGGEFSGFSGTTSVVKGTGVDNTWSIDVDTTGFKPDQYIVTVECVETTTTATTTFFVSEVPPTTATPPPTQTTVTTTTTVPPTTTTVPPTTTPGFGAVIALIGLGAVAVLVLRRH
jgi:PGF-CTERM protein